MDAFCARAVDGCGVLLLPGTLFDHEPTASRGHFRIGLGREDFPDVLRALDAWLAAGNGAPPAAAVGGSGGSSGSGSGAVK